MAPAGFEPAIPESERPQTHDLDRPAAGIGLSNRLSQAKTRITSPFTTVPFTQALLFSQIAVLSLLKDGEPG